jgi:hypothetical protein
VFCEKGGGCSEAYKVRIVQNEQSIELSLLSLWYSGDTSEAIICKNGV